MLQKSSLSLSWLVAIAFVLVLAPVAHSADNEVFSATSAITLPDSQKVTAFDISYVDPVLGLYVLADRTNAAVDVVDVFTNGVLTQWAKGQFAGAVHCPGATTGNDCAGPNGVLIVDHREAWVGDGPRFDNTGTLTQHSTIKVIDLFNQQITHTIDTGGERRADELCHDPRHHVVVMANDADAPPYISFIPTRGAQAYTVVKQISFSEATNGIEQCQWDRRTGMIYLNIPEISGPGDDSKPGAVYVIDPVAMDVVNKFDLPIDKCAGPQGMAIGPDNQILLGCNASTSSVIINDRSGAVIATLADEGGPDEVWFNDGDDHYFLARPAAATPSLGVVDAIGKSPDDSVPTGGAGTAHSVAADPIFNQVYVPIPSTATAGVCAAAGGTNSLGCIAVFTTTNDDQPVPRSRRHR